MAEVLAGVSPEFGDVAVFKYKLKSGEGYVHHFTKVTGMGVGFFTIDETHMDGCTRTRRVIRFADPNLIGFFKIVPPVSTVF